MNDKTRRRLYNIIIIIYYKRHVRSVFGFFVEVGPEVWRSAYTWWPAADGPAPYLWTFGPSLSAADAAAADPLQPPRLDRWPSTSATRTTECVSISD